MDIFTTSLKLAGVGVPDDRTIDVVDLRPVLFGKGKSPRNTMFYYRGARLFAVRKGWWKAHFITQPAYGGKGAKKHDPPVLFHLGHDPSEKRDVAKQYPEVIAEIKKLAEQHKATVKAPPSQLEIPLKKL